MCPGLDNEMSWGIECEAGAREPWRFEVATCALTSAVVEEQGYVVTLSGAHEEEKEEFVGDFVEIIGCFR